MELKFLLISLISIFISVPAYAGATDNNHIHIEQLSGGDNLDLTISQIGFGNEINFSFDHANNTFNFNQTGNDNYIGWVSYWGSGKAWGGDVDGTGNVENVDQSGGATYGRHIWDNDNTIDVYQNGTHTFNMDVHVADVEVDLWQEGTGSHYAHVYFYGTSDGSIANVMQKGIANHNAQVVLQGTEETTLNLLQQGSTNQAYSLTQNCYTVGGCTVSVTQGN